jgi:hypothetical protein
VVVKNKKKKLKRERERERERENKILKNKQTNKQTHTEGGAGFVYLSHFVLGERESFIHFEHDTGNYTQQPYIVPAKSTLASVSVSLSPVCKLSLSLSPCFIFP